MTNTWYDIYNISIGMKFLIKLELIEFFNLLMNLDERIFFSSIIINHSLLSHS